MQIDLNSYQDAAVIQGIEFADTFGCEIESGDVNGDGVQDLVVGRCTGDGLNADRPDAGEVDVVYGARRRWSGTVAVLSLPITRIVGQEALDRFGSGAVCTDLNGDGLADVVGGADFGASINNSRSQAGQAHIIFGQAALPAIIDLAQPNGTVIWGAVSMDGLGDEMAVGDINGDGTQDLILDASHATSKNGQKTQAGKVHLLFGRSAWPSSLDLATASDVTIYGATLNDNFGAEEASGDLNGDGTADLLIDVPGGDGPNDTRSSTGEINVWRGRKSWPAEIDLASATPDLTVYGVDAQDQFGRAGLAVADLDSDGTSEIVAGGPFGDGPTNTNPNMGEARSIQPGANWPATLDMRTSTRHTIFGEEAADEWCNRLEVGDVNADGILDLLCSGSPADGPSNQRTDCGEAAVVFGRVGLPADLRMANGDEDILIYGAAAGDRLIVARQVSDINDDGIPEITLRARTGIDPPRIALVYLVSPLDIDQDGYSQLADNCPLVYNPSQLDSNGDGRGDACATDWDGDGEDDALDCAPDRTADGVPREVQGVTLTGHLFSLMSWSAEQFSNSYDLLRGQISTLKNGDYGVCRNADDSNLSDTQYLDGQLPPAGDGFFYLVRGRNLHCNVAGSWGNRSSGAPRVNTNPATCP